MQQMYGDEEEGEYGEEELDDGYGQQMEEEQQDNRRMWD